MAADWFSFSRLKEVGDWMFGLRESWKKAKGEKHLELVQECARKLKEFGDKQKREGVRFYNWDTLRMQIIPHDAMVDDILEYMRKENLARQANSPDLWEIAPFIDTKGGPWG